MKQLKQLQKDNTTPEQSKRLLELGVPADSANFYLTRFGIDEDWEVKALNNIKYSELEISNQDYCLPCWSVGRLIEIELICREPQEGMIPRLSFIYGDSSENGLSSEYLIESLVGYLESGQYKYGFSKLEE